jgi:hypothetical protein
MEGQSLLWQEFATLVCLMFGTAAVTAENATILLSVISAPGMSIFRTGVRGSRRRMDDRSNDPCYRLVLGDADTELIHELHDERDRPRIALYGLGNERLE